MVVCRNCACQLPDDTLACPNCGTRIAAYSPDETRDYIAGLRPASPAALPDPPRSVKAASKAVPASICPRCGYQGQPVTRMKGSFWIELLLWFLFILPGLVYSLWRLTTRTRVCPKCEEPNMIPLDTPKGQQLAQAYSLASSPNAPQGGL